VENRDPSFLLAALCRVVPAAHATVVFDGRLSVNLGFKVLSSEEIPSKFPCPIPTLILLENESNWILFLVVRIIDTPEHTGRKPS
jgi:hypothetical protein